MAARVAAIVPLCLSLQAFSLVSFPFTFKPISNSFSLSFSRFTEVYNCWKETMESLYVQEWSTG